MWAFDWDKLDPKTFSPATQHFTVNHGGERRISAVITLGNSTLSGGAACITSCTLGNDFDKTETELKL